MVARAIKNTFFGRRKKGVGFSINAPYLILATATWMGIYWAPLLGCSGMGGANGNDKVAGARPTTAAAPQQQQQQQRRRQQHKTITYIVFRPSLFFFVPPPLFCLSRCDLSSVAAGAGFAKPTQTNWKVCIISSIFSYGY